MTDYPLPTRREDFRIAVICALRIEGDAVEALFDKIWEVTVGKEQTDQNAYTLGLIGHYNVVLAWMPHIGKGSATRAATDLRTSFRKITLILVVGICGGVPHISGGEILLGDVIISTGINQYDFGKQLPGGFRTREAVDRAPSEMSSFLNKLQGIQSRERLAENTLVYLEELLKKRGFEEVQYLGANEDKLYKATYRHKHHDLSSCDTRVCEIEDEVCSKALDSACVELKCDERELLSRERQVEWAARGPLIHFGLVASGDTVMKSGEHRDKIAAAQNVIAFEMEGAGVREAFPCVFVIKGVCDYADSHKNKKWQRYAATTGAACMKAFLKEWTPFQEEIPSLDPDSLNSIQLLQACEQRDINRIKEILEKPDTSCSAMGDRGRGVLHFAIGIEKVNAEIEGKIVNILSLLFNHGVDLNAQDKSGLCPIHYCAKSMKSQAAIFLLNNGVQVDQPDGKKRTALHYVAADSNPDVEFARMLIAKGGTVGSARLPDLVPRASQAQREVRALIDPERVPMISKKRPEGCIML